MSPRSGKYKPKKSTSHQKVKSDFCLPGLSATKITTQEYHVYESTESRYDMILGRDLLMSMRLDLKISINVIVAGEIPYEGCMNDMVDMITYDYGSLNLKNNVKPEELFIDD